VLAVDQLANWRITWWCLRILRQFNSEQFELRVSVSIYLSSNAKNAHDADAHKGVKTRS
jgi:hypothetical protein